MKSYEPFEGVIGRTLAESTPWWPDAAAPRATTRPNVVVILLDDLGFAHFGCYGSTSTRRTSTGWPPAACATPTSTSRRCARRPGPRCSPAATTTRSGMRVVSNFNTGFPHMRGHISNHAATVAEVLRDEGYATFAVGKWHLCQMEDASAAGPVRPVAVPAGLRPLLRLPRRRDRPVPPRARLRQPRGRPAGRRPTRATTSARTWSTRRSASSTTRSRSGPTGRSSSTSRSAPCTRRTRRPPTYLEKYRGRFDDGLGRRARASGSPARWSWASCPTDTELAPRNPGVEAWDDAAREPAAARGPAAGGVRRVPRPHRRPDRPAASTRSSALGELDNTMIVLLSDNGASQEGGPFGVLHEMKFFNFIVETPDEAVERARRHRRARTATPTTRGAGPRPATRRSSGTSRTPTRAASTCRCIVHWPDAASPTAAGCATSSTT